MGPALAEPRGDPVVLGDDVGDLHPVVRERVAHHVDDELDALGTERQGRRARARRLGMEDLVGDREVALVPDLVDEPLHQGVVGLARRRGAREVRRRDRSGPGGGVGMTPSCCIMPEHVEVDPAFDELAVLHPEEPRPAPFDGLVRSAGCP